MARQKHHQPQQTTHRSTSLPEPTSADAEAAYRISKRLVDLHHGTVGVSSEAGQGATFWFKLPPGGAGSASGS
jgi:light-regulated signal transduction histidine kinase (bacteriophytochrome)